MTTPSANLRAAIADLRRRRAEIDAAIVNMENVLASVYGESVSITPDTIRRTVEIGGTRSEKVRAMFVDHPGRTWTAETLLDAIQEETTETSLKGVHAILSRLARTGEIEKVRRGAYRSTNSSAPGATGAEETGESSSDSPREGGGAEDDSATSDGRDDHALGTHGLHGHSDRRAAIEVTR